MVPWSRTVLARRLAAGAVLALAVPSLIAASATAGASAQRPDEYFNRVATFAVYQNNDDLADETVAEIVDYWAAGELLVYTDGPGEQLGFVDLDDAYQPEAGPEPLAMGGEPTSVSVLGDYALVGVNTSPSFVAPSGMLKVVDLTTPAVVAGIPLGGQPDSVKASPDGRYVAVVIENERDEDVVIGEVEGGLPQLPAGLLQIVDVVGDPGSWTVRDVDLTGLSAHAPTDPEPEFVDVNRQNQAVVTLQENNHVAIVNLASGTVVNDFGAGNVDLVGIDALEDDLIEFDDALYDVPREPDAATWIGNSRVATANEGDLFGGSRGFSIFKRNGEVAFDSATSYDELARDIGHYNEGRSENKGSEPESIEHGRFGSTDYLFVGSERGSFVGVYELVTKDRPEFVQVLPAGLGPEGLLAIPERNLFVTSSEEDDPEFGVRATIMVYELGTAAPAYPEVVSDGTGWSAMSGMVADPDDPGTAHAVWDSFYAQSKVFTLDLSTTPAAVTDARVVTKDDDPVGYDLEGIALDGEGGFWVVSEGAVSGGLSATPNLLIHLNDDLEVVEEIELPEEITACRAAMIAQVPEDEDDPTYEALYAKARNLRFGFEGVTVDAGGVVHVAQQRGWEFDAIEAPLGVGSVDDCSTLSTANGGTAGAVGVTKVWQYSPAAAAWLGSTDYALDPRPEHASWVGLSEITFVDGGFVFIERDNRTGDFAEVKMLTRVMAGDFDGGIDSVEQDVVDLLPAMRATNGWVSDKPEGVAILPDGQTFVITDNDGVDDWSGETQLLRLGSVGDLFD